MMRIDCVVECNVLMNSQSVMKNWLGGRVNIAREKIELGVSAEIYMKDLLRSLLRLACQVFPCLGVGGPLTRERGWQ